MKGLYTVALVVSLVAIAFGRATIGDFPIGALLLPAVVYFRWYETLFWFLALSLWWEAAMPLPLGSTTLPLLAIGLILQLTSRHPLRGGFMTLALGAMVLQSVAQITLGLYWPPRQSESLIFQMGESTLMLALSGILAPLFTHGLLKAGEKKFNCDLESRLRDL